MPKGSRRQDFSRIMVKCYGERGVLQRRGDICSVRDSCLRFTSLMDMKHQRFQEPGAEFSAKRGCLDKIELKPGPSVQRDLFEEAGVEL